MIVSSHSLLFKRIWEVETITCKEQEERFCSNYYTHLCSWFTGTLNRAHYCTKSFRSLGWKLMTCCWRKREGNSVYTWERDRERALRMIRKNRLNDRSGDSKEKLKQGDWEWRGRAINMWIVGKQQDETRRRELCIVVAMGQTQSWERHEEEKERKSGMPSWTPGTTRRWREQMKSESRHQKAEYAGQGLC